MSRVITSLLGDQSLKLQSRINELERLSGRPAIDIRLGLDVQRCVRGKLAELKLDPVSTAGIELYRALQERLKTDEQTIRRALGLETDTTPDKVIEAVSEHIRQLIKGDKIQCIKSAPLKAILKKHKPKATMKALGYRSLDSMLKHEPLGQLLVATEMIESKAWHAKRLAAYRKLKTTDFELRRSSILYPTNKKWPQIAEEYIKKYQANILVAYEQGAVVILPLEKDMPALATLLSHLIIEAYRRLKVHGTYAKLLQVRPDYVERYVQSLQSEILTDVTIAGFRLSWNAVHRFYSSQKTDNWPEVFETHLQPEDFKQESALDSLMRLSPSLKFWQGTESAAFLDRSTVVSCNMLDVILSVTNNLPYEKRLTQNFHQSLMHEMVGSYLAVPQVYKSLVAQLGVEIEDSVAVF